VVQRDHESLAKKIDDKENIIFDLKKDLRSVKEQLNTEKIRHRRSVVQSRIPAPSTRSTTSLVHKSSIPLPSSNGVRSSSADTTPPDTDSSCPEIARIRSCVLKLLQEHDPQKAGKIDHLMSTYKGREYNLLEKMTVRYEKAKEKAGRDTTETADISALIGVDERPMSRQEKALALHKARMQGIKDKKR